MEATDKVPNLMNSYINGARKGLNLVINTIAPSIIFAYTVTNILVMTGIMKIIGELFSPVMMIFGLPGEAAIPLVLCFTTVVGASGTVASMVQSGALTETHAIMMLPFIFLTGNFFIFTARILVVSVLLLSLFVHALITNLAIICSDILPQSPGGVGLCENESLPTRLNLEFRRVFSCKTA